MLKACTSFTRKHFSIVFFFAIFPVFCYPQTSSINYLGVPPFINKNAGKPNVVIALDVSGSMKAVAYRDVTAGAWREEEVIQRGYDNTSDYYGYFNSQQRYRYDSVHELFFADDGGDWDGNFLNWIAMRRMDIARKVLTGGKVRDRAGENINGETHWVLQGQNEPFDHSFRKQYEDVSRDNLAPFPDNTLFEIKQGAIHIEAATTTATDSTSINVSVINDQLEVGSISISHDTNRSSTQFANASWHHVSYQNSYSIPPVVVAAVSSYGGSQAVHARVRNVSTSGFEVRLEEWDYLDGIHNPEDVVYIVAADQASPITLQYSGSRRPQSVKVQAGKLTRGISSPPSNFVQTQIHFDTAFDEPPMLFTGISTDNDIQAVVSRVDDVKKNTFKVGMIMEEANTRNANGRHDDEEIHWIAIEQFEGKLDSGASIEVDQVNSISNNTTTETFVTNLFSQTPLFLGAFQENKNEDAADLRVTSLNSEGYSAFAQEETSYDAELTHSEVNMGFIAVEATGTAETVAPQRSFNIQVATETEPKGIVQQNSERVRFGLAVYNFDHTISPDRIYQSNVVHGGTFHPCYPDITLPEDERSNYDICYETHVRSPLNNIIQVIEEHPLLWGTTPIAETLYEIKGYFSQTNHNKNGHSQYYDNGTESGGSQRRNSYEISQAWDPYYYPELESKNRCATSVVVHVNDGAPFTDFDIIDNSTETHPIIPHDGRGPQGENSELDDLALALRNQDCRTDATMEGHQEIRSYYVYTALGQNEANGVATTTLREAAANGGFERTGEGITQAQHPGDFTSYINTGRSNPDGCQETLWDVDPVDCNPDGFFFANSGEQLTQSLNDLIDTTVAINEQSASSLAISSQSVSGAGSVVSADFRHDRNGIKWTGDVYATLLDENGHLRHDKNKDKTLHNNYETTPIIDMCSDPDTQTNVVRVAFSTSPEARPTAEDFFQCNPSKFSNNSADIHHIWRASTWLNGLTNLEATAQRPALNGFTNTKKRYIITGIDENGDGNIRGNEVVDFLPNAFPSEYAGLISDSEADAADIIQYIRGQDFDHLRNRTVNQVTYRLGDIMHSTPVVVGAPAEKFDLLYKSNTYKDFLMQHKHRRNVVYVGGNDGMLHAFNAGWYNDETRKFENHPPAESAPSDAIPLGGELWAYVPYNALPHLKYITQPAYGKTITDHLYFVDGKPRVFDARITTGSDGDWEWATIMVVGMRFGGGKVTVDRDLGTNIDPATLTSSYSIFDITDPEQPPKLLLEFTHPNLGFTVSHPTPLQGGALNKEGLGGWHLVVGSGPDNSPVGFHSGTSTQDAHIFQLQLKNVAKTENNIFVSGYGTNGIKLLGEPNSFISHMVAADFQLHNMASDAIYFGSVSGPIEASKGKVYRLNNLDIIDNNASCAKKWEHCVLYDAQAPVSAGFSLGSDRLGNRWIIGGTGRLLSANDNLTLHNNHLFGIKENRDNDGFTYTQVDNILDMSNVSANLQTGAFSSALSISGSSNTVNNVENLMFEMSSNKNIDGWKIQLNAGERHISNSALVNGSALLTTFKPTNEVCSGGGQSWLYNFNALTGTVNNHDTRGINRFSTVKENSINQVTATPDAPELFIPKEGPGPDVLNKSSDGSIQKENLDQEDAIKSSEINWGELFQ